MSKAHKLKEVVVQGFKSIKDQRVPIGDLNVLIGQNGAGKSNFIQLFRFVRNIIEERLQIYVGRSGGADRILYYGSRPTKSMMLALDFRPNMYQINLGTSQNDNLFIELELGYFDHGLSSKIYKEMISSPGAFESGLLQYTKEHKYGVPVHIYNVMRSWRVYHFHDTSENAGVKKHASLADNIFLFEDASNIAAVLYLMKQKEQRHYDRIVKTVQLVIPFFKDFVLRPNPLNESTIILEWQDKFSDKVFSASELSDGSLRFICLATLLLQPELPALILLDEPELGLHPSAVNLLAGLLQKASKKTQVIVSTQSVGLLNDMEPNDIIVVDRKKESGESEFKRLDEERLKSWLENYTLGELWQQNVIGGKP